MEWFIVSYSVCVCVRALVCVCVLYSGFKPLLQVVNVNSIVFTEIQFKKKTSFFLFVFTAYT